MPQAQSTQTQIKFEFEFIQSHAATLEIKINTDEKGTVNEYNQTTTFRPGKEVFEPGNHAGNPPMPANQLFGLANTGFAGAGQSGAATPTPKSGHNAFTGGNTGFAGKPHQSSNQYGSQQPKTTRPSRGGYTQKSGNVGNGALFDLTFDYRPQAKPLYVEPVPETLEQPVVEVVKAKPAIQFGVDYVIKPEDKLGVGGAKAKFRDNIEAIRVLKALQTNGPDYATFEEQKALVRYVGWGGLPQAFDNDNLAWKKEYEELRQLLSPDEYSQAKRSTQDAHYTSEDVIAGMYAGLKHFGVNGQTRTLEPSAGTGNFFGLRPQWFKYADDETIAIELDPVTAGIGRFLYPQVSYKNKGFQEVLMPEQHFDIAIGNPPFGSQHIHDQNRPDLDFSIHNYFLAKSIDSLREGGIGAFVVSRYFLDAQDSSAREFITTKANLLGAIRLPNTAFKANALTEVTADIVFFQRTAMPEQNPAWLKTGELTMVPDVLTERFGDLNLQDRKKYRFTSISDAFGALHYHGWGSFETVKAYAEVFNARIEGQVDYEIALTHDQYEGHNDTDFYTELKRELHMESGADKAIRLNQYYLDNPGQMVGSMAVTNKIFGDTADLLPPPNMGKLEDEITARLALLPQNIYTARPWEDKTAAIVKSHEDLVCCGALKPGSYFMLKDSQIGRRLPDVMGEPDFDIYTPRNATAGKRIEGLVVLRDTLHGLLEMEEMEGVADAVLNMNRNRLNALYDGFIKKHGYVNSLGNRMAMRDDPSYPLLASLEREYDKGISKTEAESGNKPPRPPSAKKADIFSRRVLNPKKEVTHVETSKEALFVAMNKCGQPDFLIMEQLTGKSTEQIAEDLEGLIYLNPINESWETAEKYLSGNVKVKLLEAKEASINDTRYRLNIEALLAVQPPDIAAVDISVELGITWLPQRDMHDFCTTLFGREAVKEVSYHRALGHWYVEITPSEVDDGVLYGQWGTKRYPAHKLIDAVLQGKQIKVRDPIGEDPYTGRMQYAVNEEETLAANVKADDLKQAFTEWIWQDAERRERLARIYNDKFNTHAPKRYNGDHLELPGSSNMVALRKHQKDAIWRGIQDQTMLADHIVGAGKTYCAVAIIMESKRMGLMDKPIVVVPNHLLIPWQDAFYNLYPKANILVAGKEDFTRQNREKLFAKMATNDWDAIIVPQSSFQKIGLPPDMLKKIVNEELDNTIEAIRALKEESGETRGLIKRLEKQRERMEARMQKQLKTQDKDKALTFNQTGIDRLFVDEWQDFKNLYISTNLSNVAGLGNLEGSDRAMDMYVKARYLQDKHGGKGMFPLTGTPLSNSIVEIYTLFRTMDYAGMVETDTAHFDQWRAVYGRVATGWELDNTGENYKIRQRFSQFVNLPELMSKYRSYADVIIQEDIDAVNDGKSLVPKIKGGRPTNVICQRSDELAAYMQTIIERMENMPRDPKEDNALKATTDARLASLDLRIKNPNAEDYAGSKVNVAVRNIFDTWRQWDSQKGTQLVFCDLSTPKNKKNAAVAENEENGDVPVQDEYASLSFDEIVANKNGFSVYEDIKAKLIKMGVPQDQVCFIHDYNTDMQKAKLFEAMNRGDVRVLLGSTRKMGAGTNVQRRLVALHHLDCPYRPADLQQREGRIIRFGNYFHETDPDFEVGIYRYATEKTYDARQYQLIEVKANAIGQLRKGDSLTREIDDIYMEAANAAEMKAAATGNEYVFLQVQLATELKKMEILYKNHKQEQFSLQDRIADLEKKPQRLINEMDGWQKEVEYRDKNTPRDFFFACGGSVYTKEERKEILDLLYQALGKVSLATDYVNVGEYRGYTISVAKKSNSVNFYLEGENGKFAPSNLKFDLGKGEEINLNGLFQRVDNCLGSFEKFRDAALKEKERSEREYKLATEKLGVEFSQMDLLKLMRSDNAQVMDVLQRMKKDPEYIPDWKPQSLEYKKEEKQPAVSLER